MPGGLLRNDGDAIRVTVMLDTAGAANTPTEFKFKFGGATASAFRQNNDANKLDSMVQFFVVRTGATAQKISALGMTAVANSCAVYQSGTETLSGDITISTLHGANSSATDYIQQIWIMVEYLPKPF